MGADPGQMYRWLADAVSCAGTPRSVYSQDTTLTRRGLLQRADRRARELQSAGLGPGSVVIVSMGNVVEFLVLLLAASRQALVVVPVDPTSGDAPLVRATGRVPVRCVVRRPRGSESSAPSYPRGYGVRSRKRLSGSLLTMDVLDPPDNLPGADLPPDAELIIETLGSGGVVRDVVRAATHLRAIGEAAAAALDLSEGTRMLCAQPFTVPRFFDPVVLGWLASEAQLIMAEGPVLDTVLPTIRGDGPLVVVDSVRNLLDLCRTLKASGTTHELTPVIPQSTVPLSSGRPLKQAFGNTPLQLLQLEEIGILASRRMERGARFEAAAAVDITAGDAMEVGGREVLASSTQAYRTQPPPGPGEPGAPVDKTDARHTGYAAKFAKDGTLAEIIGRDDGLVNLEGRRACLDNIEDVMLEHRRLTWVRADLDHAPDGDPQIVLEYRATGETDVDDIEEHAVGNLAPHMVPRELIRLTD